MSLLCIDAGNTRLKWGLRDQETWLAQGVIEHDDIAALAERLPARPRRMIACNVADSVISSRIEALGAVLDVPLEWFRSLPEACGVTNGYDHPEQLGADRWAALIGARGLHPGPAVVVMAGTATTIDTLDADGMFRGGLILPGLDLMRQSLARNTARLPEASGVYRDFPTNTDDAIVSGTLHATLGAIERMARRLHADGERFGAAEQFVCLLSGGAAEALAPHIELPVRRVDNLVLEGLARSGT